MALIRFSSAAALIRWLRLVGAPLRRRSQTFWTEVHGGRLLAGSTSEDEAAIVEVMLQVGDSAPDDVRRWHRLGDHPTSQPARKSFDTRKGAKAAPGEPSPSSRTPFGEVVAPPPELLRHPLAQKVDRQLPGLLSEIKHHAGRYTLHWAAEGVWARLQLSGDLPAPRRAAAPEAPLKPAKDPLGGFVGGTTQIIHAGRSCALGQPAQWRLVEVERLIPSHDADTFQRRADYPTGVQERRYHKDKAEQQKVLDNSGESCFQPAIVANTDPTALGGAPIATPSGVVLGGNSRTMVLQRIYRRGQKAAARHKAYLAEHLHAFGLPPAALASMKAPVIVRVVQSSDDKAVLRDLVRRYNETLTQELERAAEQVATSARIDDRILAELLKIEDDTLASFLASPASEPLVRLAVSTELIPRSKVNVYLSQGRLSAEGRAFFMRALVGRVLPDPDLIELLDPSIQGSLALAVPYLLNAAQVHTDPTARARWDVSLQLPAAVRLWSRAKAARENDATALARQRELTDDGLDTLTTANVLLANVLLQRSGSRQLPDGLRTYAEASAYTTTPSLFGQHEEPVPALARAFKLKLPADPAITPIEHFDTPPKPPKPPKATPQPPPAPPKPPVPAQLRIDDNLQLTRIIDGRVLAAPSTRVAAEWMQSWTARQRPELLAPVEDIHELNELLRAKPGSPFDAWFDALQADPDLRAAEERELVERHRAARPPERRRRGGLHWRSFERAAPEPITAPPLLSAATFKSSKMPAPRLRHITTEDAMTLKPQRKGGDLTWSPRAHGIYLWSIYGTDTTPEQAWVLRVTAEGVEALEHIERAEEADLLKRARTYLQPSPTTSTPKRSTPRPPR